MAVVYLGIGSNLGKKRANIRRALSLVGALNGTRVLKVSRFMRSRPAGGPLGQPDFLNAAARISTGYGPHALLEKLKGIEKAMGRKRSVRNGPRVIDLDILFYEERLIRSKTLTVPHPRMFEREFVIRPLLEVL